VIEKYEPFYSTGFEYAAPADVQFGEKIEMFYDPRGQVIRTVNPDASEQRVIFGVPGTIAVPDFENPDIFEPTPWEAYSYDPNDNAGRTHPDASSAYRHHWNTPASILIDALGRTILSVARNRDPPAKLNDPLPPIEEIRTSSTYDIRGNVLTITGALHRSPAFTHVYDLANRPLRIDSIDAGIRRTILDAAGSTIEHRDSKDAVVLNAYDVLNRPTHLWARDIASELVNLRERLIYGDDLESGLSAEQIASGNLLGKLYRHYDEAGLVSFMAYDFKGNLVDKQRQVISATQILSVFAGPLVNWNVKAYRVDWAPDGDSSRAALQARAAALLDPQVYQTSSVFDALNRVRLARYPRDGARKELRPTYNRAGALEKVSLDGAIYVDRISYDAKGQCVLIAYGNGVMIRHAYDVTTFRLSRLRTERFTVPTPGTYRPTGMVLQDFGYDYDLVGNIWTIHDRTPESGILSSVLGTDALDRAFGYDAIYRLVSASGRECDRPLELPWVDAQLCTDFTKTRAYLQKYKYDLASNIRQLRHVANGGAFIRDFTLVPDNTAPQNNRLKEVTVGSNTYGYTYDDNGNMSEETTSRHFEWDHSDRMRVFRTQTANAEPSVHAHYLYDSSNQRIEKLIRKQGGQVEVTVYVDGLFEHQQIIRRHSLQENNTLHVMDNQSRVALVRIGPAFSRDATPSVKYQLSDHLRSSNVVVGGSTATTSSFVNREEYTPYGETSFGSFATKRYRFSGKERDEESGLNYHGARFYAPWLARWTSCDPSGPIDGPNICKYTNNPIRMTDPSGTDEIPEGYVPPTPEANVRESIGNPDGPQAIEQGPLGEVQASGSTDSPVKSSSAPESSDSAPPVSSPPPLASVPPMSPPPLASERAIDLPEMVIDDVPVPHEPDVSHPKALERAQGAGHIEAGDYAQFGKGLYHGMTGWFGLAELDFRLPEFDVDERYAGAEQVGRELGENLVTEGAGAVVGKALKGAGVLLKPATRGNAAYRTFTRSNFVPSKHLHHLFPQEFAREFKALFGKKFDVHKFVINLEAEKHIGREGIHVRTSYNQQWLDFFYGGDTPTKEGAIALLNDLFAEMGLRLEQYKIGSLLK
jgi:RHS repeat-associated protein